MRAAVILVADGKVALIRRTRGGRVYFLFPGGGVSAGETPEEAAVREAHEELGLSVSLGPRLAEIRWNGRLQLFFRATVTGGTFGTGSGDEITRPPDADLGTYEPVWLDLGRLAADDVRPRSLALALARDPDAFLARRIPFQGSD